MRYFKYILTLLVTLSLLWPVGSASAAIPVRLSLNGTLLDAQKVPGLYQNEQNRIMIPVRCLPDLFQVKTAFDKKTGITITWPARADGSILVETLKPQSSTIQWDDTATQMDCQPVNKNDRVYVPLVYVIMPSDAVARWDETRHILHLFTKGQSPEEQDQIIDKLSKAGVAYTSYDIKSVPILMYHQVSDDPGKTGFNDLIMQPALFVEQLDYLQNHGYTTVSMLDLYNAWYKGAPLPAKPVVLTFDDGYEAMYTFVFPELQKRQMTGTFFVVANYLNTVNSLTPEQCKAMQDGGMDIQSHTYTHNELPQVSDLEKELNQSRKVLESVIGAPVQFLCYPSGKYNSNVMDKAKQYGYLMAVTTQPGIASKNQNPLELPRVRMSRGDTASALAAKLGQ